MALFRNKYMKYTTGVRRLVEEQGMHWLLDEIAAANRSSRHLRTIRRQIWTARYCRSYVEIECRAWRGPAIWSTTVVPLEPVAFEPITLHYSEEILSSADE